MKPASERARCLYGFFLLGAHIMLCGAKAKKRRGGIKFIRRTLLLLSFLCAPTALYFYEVYEKSTSATRYNNNKTRRRNNDDKMMLLRVLLADNFWCLLWPRANKRVKAATESYSTSHSKFARTPSWTFLFFFLKRKPTRIGFALPPNLFFRCSSHNPE